MQTVWHITKYSLLVNKTTYVFQEDCKECSHCFGGHMWTPPPEVTLSVRPAGCPFTVKIRSRWKSVLGRPCPHYATALWYVIWTRRGRGYVQKFAHGGRLNGKQSPFIWDTRRRLRKYWRGRVVIVSSIYPKLYVSNANKGLTSTPSEII